MPPVNTLAPDFTLRDQNGNEHSLRALMGKWVLIYFYPKDDTPGCTREACVLRDAFPQFEKLNVQILGVSADDEKSHKKFEEKYMLPFTLLADVDKRTVKDYGVWAPKKFMGREFLGILRTSFLIDPKGKIVKIYENVKPADHADEVLKDLKELQK
jgi:peroxiredoxin Q/BCP